MYGKTAALMLALLTCGCGSSPAPTVSKAKEEVLRSLREIDAKAAAKKPLRPVIELPLPAGWTRSEPRSLPESDHGFTVGYDHASGITVTLYQFTRGLPEIPDDLNAQVVQLEMQRAKTGIEDAVQLGLWESAKQVASKDVKLGSSAEPALWARHQLKKDGVELVSDTYVWVGAGTFIKLRCTTRPDTLEQGKDAVTALLTALGEACQAKK